jgi:hypothetical protein
MASYISCKELISIFEKIGGKFVCHYDKKECTLLPQNITVKFTTQDDGINIGRLVGQYGYSGQFDDFVTLLPETEEQKKWPFIPELIHYYQYKNAGGFIMEYLIG